MDKRVEIKSSVYNIEGTLKEASKAFQALINQIPPKYRDTARVDYEKEEEYGCTYVYVVLSYTRPETLEERAERVKQEEARNALQERRNRETYEKLKAQFEKE